MGNNSGNIAELKPTTPKKLGKNGIKQVILEALATAYSTTPAEIERDLLKTDGDFGLAELIDSLVEAGY